MASVVEIRVKLDAQGLPTEIRRVTRDIESSGSAIQQSFRGILGATPFSALISGYGAAAAAAVYFGKKSVDASLDAVSANRVLASTTTFTGASYASAAEGAKKLSQSLIITERDASRVYANIQRLAASSGDVGKTDALAQNLADLSAARGISTDQIKDIATQLLSGGGLDDATKKLFGKNPSTIYADYANQLNKVSGAATHTATSLSDLEKHQAITNELAKIGGQLQGSAADRLRGVDGQVAQVAKDLGDLEQYLGDNITQSFEFRSALGALVSGLDALTGSHRDARLELAKGLKTPAQIAQEERDSVFGQTKNFIKGVVSAPFALGGAGVETIGTLGLHFANRGDADAQRSVNDNYESSLRGYLFSVLNPGQAAYDDRVRVLTEEQQKIQSGDKKSAAVQEMEDNQKAINTARKQTLDYLKDFYSQADKIIGNSFSRSEQDNPFVKIFADGVDAVRRMREEYGHLGKDAVQAMIDVDNQVSDFLRLKARLDSQTSALELRQKAARFGQPLIGLTGPDERYLDVYKARLGGVLEQRNLTNQADALSALLRGVTLPGKAAGVDALDAIQAIKRAEFSSLGLKVGYDSPEAARAAFAAANKGLPESDRLLSASDRLNKLAEQRAKEPGQSREVRRAIQTAIDEQIIKATEGIDFTDARSKSFQLYQAGQERESALRRRADGQGDIIRQEIERAQASAQLVEETKAQLANVRSIGDKADPGNVTGLADKKFLSILDRLDPKELTAELRLEGAASAQREAQREADKEKRALAAIEEDRAFKKTVTERLITASDALLKKGLINIRVTGDKFTDLKNFSGPANGGGE